MMILSFRSVVYALVGALMLSIYGCGGGSGSDDTQNMLIWPSLGQIQNPTVQLSHPDGSQIDITTSFNGDGSILATFSASVTGPVTVEILGNSGATYFDEASGLFEPFGLGESIRHVLASPTAVVGVSALTEFAASLLDSVPILDAAIISQANELIRAALAPSMNSIVIPPQIIGSLADLALLENSEAGEYAAILGALAQLHSTPTDPTPALEIVNQLQQDILNGVIDGLDVNGATINGLAYDENTFVGDFTTAVNAIDDGSPLDGNDYMTVNTNVGILDTNQPPTADAGPDQTVDENDPVNLTGAASTDSDGTVEGYAWMQDDSTGINLPLFDADTATPTFTAPNVTADTTFTFSLVVTDNDGADSAADSVDVTVTYVPPPAGFTLSGTITGPNPFGDQWILLVNGNFANDGPQFSAGPVTYNFIPIISGSTYEVTAPVNCTVTNGTGTVTADITNIDIDCVLPPPL